MIFFSTRLEILLKTLERDRRSTFEKWRTYHPVPHSESAYSPCLADMLAWAQVQINPPPFVSVIGVCSVPRPRPLLPPAPPPPPPLLLLSFALQMRTMKPNKRAV